MNTSGLILQALVAGNKSVDQLMLETKRVKSSITASLRHLRGNALVVPVGSLWSITKAGRQAASDEA